MYEKPTGQQPFRIDRKFVLGKRQTNDILPTESSIHHFQQFAMEDTDKHDTEESDLDDYLDDDDDLDAEWLEQQLEEEKEEESIAITSEILDIREPLTTLRERVGGKLMIDLSHCEFHLESSEKLDPESTLAEYCEKDDGLVEIDFEIKEGFNACNKRKYMINIVNVVEPRDKLDTNLERKGPDNIRHDTRPENIASNNKSFINIRCQQSNENPREIRKTIKRPTVILGKAKPTVLVPSGTSTGGYRSGRNGQLELWRYLLDLLTDKEHRDVIYWVGDDGEFKMENPETVSKLWGAQKNNPRMNYEKMSRALRFYNGGDIINKVRGKNFMYKFVCDLKEVIGYSVKELKDQMIDAVEKENRNKCQ